MRSTLRNLVIMQRKDSHIPYRRFIAMTLFCLTCSPASAEIVTYKIHYTVKETLELPYNFMAVYLIRGAGRPEHREVGKNLNDWRDFSVGDHTVTVTTESIGVPDQIKINLAYYQHLYVIGPFTVECSTGEKLFFNECLFLSGRSDNGLSAKTENRPLIITDQPAPSSPPKMDHDEWEHQVFMFDNSQGEGKFGLKQEVKSALTSDAEYLDGPTGRWKSARLTDNGNLPGEAKALHAAYDRLRQSATLSRSVNLNYELPAETMVLIEHAGRTRWKCEPISVDGQPVIMRVRKTAFETRGATTILIPTRDSEGGIVPVLWRDISWMFSRMTYDGNEDYIKQLKAKKAEWLEKGWVR
ncbi:MAG: hypothetical protein AB8G99_13230 [Planctomycetaceae bacterium]